MRTILWPEESSKEDVSLPCVPPEYRVESARKIKSPQNYFLSFQLAFPDFPGSPNLYVIDPNSLKSFPSDRQPCFSHKEIRSQIYIFGSLVLLRIYTIKPLCPDKLGICNKASSAQLMICSMCNDMETQMCTITFYCYHKRLCLKKGYI